MPPYTVGGRVRLVLEGEARISFETEVDRILARYRQLREKVARCWDLERTPHQEAARAVFSWRPPGLNNHF